MISLPVDWQSALLVLAAGIALGVFLLFRFRSTGGDDVVVDSLERRDLQLRFDELIRELRELSDTAGKFTRDQQRSERDRLERDAARTLRRLESMPQEEELPARVSAGGNAALRRMIWLTGATLAGAVLYVLLLQFTAPRDTSAPMTGAVGPMAEADAQFLALQQKAKDDPADLDAHVALAKAYLERREMSGVDEETRLVLQKEPGHPRALAYQALVRLSAGDAAAALAMLKQSVQNDPNLLEGWMHMSVVYFQMGNRKAALDALDIAMQRHPESADSLRILRHEMESAGAGAPPAGDDALYSGRIVLPPTGQAVEGEILFVTLRAAAVTSGPPLAVKRLAVSTAPIEFSFSDADSMRGEPLPRVGRIEARVDRDGDPLTHDAGELRAVVDQVSAGSKKIELTLRPQVP